MHKNLVPIQIRPHLIPFLYKELKEAADVDYLAIRAKSCKISKNASIGKTLIAILSASKKYQAPDNFYIYFYVPKKITATPTAHIYQIVNGKEELLKVTEKLAKDLNYIFEDLFRYAFVNTVYTAKKYAPNLKTEKIILDFMQTYNLEEHGFKVASMRSLYNREIKNKCALQRFQTKSSNRVLNF